MLLVIDLEEVTSFIPLRDCCCCFVGGRLDLPTSSLHSMYKRSHSHCLVDLLIFEGEATCEEFPPNFCEFSDMFPKDLPCMSRICDLSSR